MIDREKGLSELRKKLSKDGALYKLSEQRPIEVMSTGIATLDSALGVGGFVRGSQVIIWGPQGAGKSALCYSAIGNLMKRDPNARACIFDMERSASPEWLEKFGVDTDRTYILEEPDIQSNIEAFQQVMRSCVFDYIVIDSIGAMVSDRQFNGKDGKGGDANTAQVGGVSKNVTDWVNKANAELVCLDKVENSGNEVVKPTIIWINQIRAKLDSMYGGYDMPGGYALRHQAKVVIRVTASNSAGDKIYGTVNGAKELVGTRVVCKIEKNKYAPKERQAGYDFCFEECEEHEFGIDSMSALFELAVKYGVFAQSGAWISYGSEGEPGYVKAQGKRSMMGIMRDNPEFSEDVYDKTMAMVSKENEDGMQYAEED